MRQPTRLTLQEVAEQWLEGAKAGAIRARSRKPYKPSALRGYEHSLKQYVLPTLGTKKLSNIDRSDIQALVERLLAEGLSPSTVRNALLPLRAIYRRGLRQGIVAVNPTRDIELPLAEARRTVDLDKADIEPLLSALPEADQPLWATAFYAGLRRGELRALRWEDVDLARGAIRVERGWDDKEAEIEPKSKKGRRVVPLTPTLRDYLAEHKMRTGRAGTDLVFGTGPRQPFTPSNIRKRAAKAWERANAKQREEGLPLLVPVTLHQARHAYVSLMADAGFTLERIGDYVGHSSAYMTDRYRHLMRDHLAEAARQFDDYLARDGSTNAPTNAQAAQTA